MINNIILSLLVFETVLCATLGNPSFPKKDFIYNTYKYDTVINTYINNETEQILDFYENSELYAGYPTRVHVSLNESVLVDYPIFVTATQQKGVSAWELPLVVQTKKFAVLFNDMAQTLCPHDAGPDIKTENRPTIHISTENPKNTSVDVKLERVTDFYIELDKEISFNVTPSTPNYYFFSFDQNPWNITNQYTQNIDGLPIFNYTIPKSVILVVDSPDELCATVSIQDNSCPVFDNEKEIMYQGYHLTMTSKGGITLTQTMFPRGFYVVFVVKESDADCTGASETGLLSDVKNRSKIFKFTIIATVSYKEYVIGAIVLLAVVSLVAAFVLMVAVPFRYRPSEIDALRSIFDSLNREEEPGNSQVEDDSDVTHLQSETPDVQRARYNALAEEALANQHSQAEDDGGALTVGKLTQAPPDTLARRSDRYFWGALTLAVVYALPVVQLLFTYQQMVFATGNQDLCYYNFLCAHPLGFLSDFNHVFSNIGYVVLGVAFMLQVRARQKTRPDALEMGIPPHYGLLYAMGLALCMEGFLSACYHLCPNKMNFQFDSSFMYVIAVLVMIKLYQNRHSDLIPSAHSTFMLIALIMSIGLFGILFPSVYFSVIFTLLHIMTCLILTVKIYYAGSFKMERAVFGRAWSLCRVRGARALVPAHTARAVLLALANVANWTFAVYSAVERNKDFARQLLAILMGNAILYTMFYVCMKIIHRERILIHTWVYFVFAHIAWFGALSQFVNGNTRWSETPALSRRRNAYCTALHMWDRHDVWHVASAAAMFLSFNMLLTVDDALTHTRTTHIATF